MAISWPFRKNPVARTSGPATEGPPVSRSQALGDAVAGGAGAIAAASSGNSRDGTPQDRSPAGRSWHPQRWVQALRRRGIWLIHAPLPFLGKMPLAVQLRILATATVVLLLLALIAMLLNLLHAGRAATHAELTGVLMMHSQRLAKAVPTAIQGNAEAFVLLRDSRDRFAQALSLLERGGGPGGEALTGTSAAAQAALVELARRWTRTRDAADTVLSAEATLGGIGATLRRINQSNPRLLELTEQVAAIRLRENAGAREIADASRLVMLTQRIAKNANELLAADGASPEVAFLLGKDINTFRDLIGTVAANVARRDSEFAGLVDSLHKEFIDFQRLVADLLANQQSLGIAKLAQQLVFRENEALRGQIEALQDVHRADNGVRYGYLAALVVAGMLAFVTGLLIVRLYLADSAARASEAERRSLAAQHEEDLARQQNASTQAAIKRLMDELQRVADGDLTVHASVADDLTGAIADSVNYTVEELRLLVARINNTAAGVTAATSSARETSRRLLQAARQQADEIAHASAAVLHMAGQINDVSGAASESAAVARSSLAAAEEGQIAVANTMAGMNEIREQIQETSKRIKRLGESSQEIGEMTDLISDLTEQTNVLALNAAIQAAAAGDAGRGFSVVAEEVQRLAERSAAATRQIGALVRTIQTDTQDAVAAMEASTQGVVEGARLSDAAGRALANIDRVSRQLAHLIENISLATAQQASAAKDVEHTIHDIQQGSEENAAGTQLTASAIDQLALLVEELKSSVARFKVT